MTSQDRYLRHQARKAGTLAQVLDDELSVSIDGRTSVRRFEAEPVPSDLIDIILDAGRRAPSSCDRQAITAKVITARDDKALLGGLLVGGVGWVHRAPLILLLTADPSAYVAPGERDFMPYLDAGHHSQNIMLAAMARGLGTCFINPNIRERNVKHMAREFTGEDIYCGAVAVGWPRTD